MDFHLQFTYLADPIYTSEMSSEITLEGITYVLSKQAALATGYTQDYIGQLARRGLVEARRAGGLWYISLDSLRQYKTKADSVFPVPPKRNRSSEPDAVVSFDGKGYVSGTKAAEMTGYHQDYIGQLARRGTVLSRLAGNRWYVSRDGILAHKKEKDALLAAVQAESVGISRNKSKTLEGEPENSSKDEAVSLLKYFHENGHSLPPLRKDEEIESTEYESVYESNSEDAHRVPIRVIPNAATYAVGQKNASRITWPTSDLRIRQASERTVFLGALFAIVVIASIVILIGVFSFSGQSQQEMSDLDTASPQLVEDYSRGHPAGFFEGFWTAVDTFSAVLEDWLVPEILYTRSR